MGTQRKSIRLQDYSYSEPGFYYITIRSKKGSPRFGEVVDSRMSLNSNGGIVRRVWDSLPARFRQIAVDAFVIMPNHVHGILQILPTPVGAIGQQAGMNCPYVEMEGWAKKIGGSGVEKCWCRLSSDTSK